MPSIKRKNYEKVDRTDEEDNQNTLNSQNNGEDVVIVNLKLPEDKIVKVEISSQSNVEQLREVIFERTNVEPERQRLIHFGKLLKSDQLLEAIGVKDGDFIHLMPLPENVNPSRQGRAANDNIGMEFPDVYNVPGIGVDFINNLSNEEYFQLVELNLWRARVRLLSSLMMFYYFLQGMGNLSIWLHPEEMDLRFTPDHHPSNLFFTTDLIESMIGLIAAITGMKAATSDSTVHSALFIRNVLETGCMHFISFIIWNQELVNGKIVLNPDFNHDGHHTDQAMEQGAIFMSVVFSVMVNLFVWWSIVSVAFKYHVALQIMAAEELITEENQSAPAVSGQFDSVV